MNLLVLSDISQVEYLLKHQADVLTYHRPMTQDLAVAHALDRLQIPFMDEFDYLSPKDIEENWNQAHELAENWQQSALPGNEPSLELSSLAKQDLVYPLEICLNASTAYRRILESETVESLSGYWLPAVPVIRTGPMPVTRAANSLAQAVLRWLADQKQIPIHSLQYPRPLSVERLGGRARQPAVAVPVNKWPVARCEKVVVMLETTLRVHEQSVLEQHFESTTDYRLVRILPWELESAGLFATVIHQTEWDVAIQTARRSLASSRREYRGPYPEIFANPYLEFQFLRILDEIQVSARIGTAFGSVLDVLQPSLLILGHDAFTQERILVWQAQERGIPTVSLIHTGLGHSAGWRGIVGTADHVLVWGEDDVRLLESYGVNPARIHTVGSLQYMQKYSQVDQVRTVEQVSNRRTAAKRKLGLAETQPVVALLTSSTSSGFAAIFANPPSHRKTWTELVRLAESHPDITFAIKPHSSYDHFEFYRYLTNRGPENLVFLESAILDDVLAAAEVAVLVNYCTTAALEAMLAHIPVVFIRTAILPLESREDSLKGHGAVPVTSMDELASILDRLLQDETARAAALDDAQWVLRQSLGEKDRPVLAAIGIVLDKIILGSLPTMGDRRRSAVGCTFAVELARAAHLLWAGAGTSAYLQAVRDLRMPEQENLQSDIWSEANLFSLAYSLGTYAEGAAMLFQLVSKSLKAMGFVYPVTARARQQFLLIAFLTAMIRAVDTGQWKVGRSYARVILRQLPGTLVRSRLYQRLLMTCLAGGPNRFLFRIVTRCWTAALTTRKRLWTSSSP